MKTCVSLTSPRCTGSSEPWSSPLVSHLWCPCCLRRLSLDWRRSYLPLVCHQLHQTPPIRVLMWWMVTPASSTMDWKLQTVFTQKASSILKGKETAVCYRILANVEKHVKENKPQQPQFCWKCLVLTDVMWLMTVIEGFTQWSNMIAIPVPQLTTEYFNKL